MDQKEPCSHWEALTNRSFAGARKGSWSRETCEVSLCGYGGRGEKAKEPRYRKWISCRTAGPTLSHTTDSFNDMLQYPDSFSGAHWLQESPSLSSAVTRRLLLFPFSFSSPRWVIQSPSKPTMGLPYSHARFLGLLCLANTICGCSSKILISGVLIWNWGTCGTRLECQSFKWDFDLRARVLVFAFGRRFYSQHRAWNRKNWGIALTVWTQFFQLVALVRHIVMFTSVVVGLSFLCFASLKVAHLIAKVLQCGCFSEAMVK